MYLIITGNFNELIVDEKTRNKVIENMQKGVDYYYIGKSFIKLSSIQGIIYLPDIQKTKDIKSGKTHPMYKRWIREKNNYGYKKSFETYLDEINYREKSLEA